MIFLLKSKKQLDLMSMNISQIFFLWLVLKVFH